MNDDTHFNKKKISILIRIEILINLNNLAFEGSS